MALRSNFSKLMGKGALPMMGKMNRTKMKMGGYSFKAAKSMLTGKMMAGMYKGKRGRPKKKGY